MKPNELRIGNWVYGMNTLPSQITAYDYEHSDFDKIEPIPLTLEILERCGFKYSKDDNKFYGNNFQPLFFIQSGFYGLVGLPFYCKIKYLHQLQNLYFALTGQELEINL